MHPLNVTYLVLGLLCLGLSGLWLADLAGWVTHASYLFPVLLIVVGLVSLLAFGARGVTGRARDRRARREPDQADPSTDTTTDTTTITDDDQEALR